MHFARLPIPKAHEATRIAAGHEAPVGTDADIRLVPRGVVTPETLLAVLPKPIRGRVHDDLIVAALEQHRFARWVRARRRQGVHVRLGDEFDRHRDVEFPGAQRLVVRGRDEAAVLIDECDGVDGL